MKERFKIHKDGILPRSNKIFMMNICGKHGIKQCQQATLALIKTFDLLRLIAVRGFHKFTPPVGSPVETKNRAEFGCKALTINPAKELLKSHIYGQAMGLVN